MRYILCLAMFAPWLGCGDKKENSQRPEANPAPMELADAPEFYVHVPEALHIPERFGSSRLRIHGLVEAGSIVESITDESLNQSFILAYEGARIRVHHAGPKPDTFRDLSEVVALGTLVFREGEYQLDALELATKCPSKYEAN